MTQNAAAVSDTVQAPSLLFSVGTVLARAWRVLFKNPGVFFGLGVLNFSMLALVMYCISTIAPNMNPQYIGFLEVLTGMLLTQWIGGAVAYAAYQSLKGIGVSLGESLLRGTRRIVPLFLAGIVVGLCTALGSLAFVLPGLILSCMWGVVVPACAVERLSVGQSLTRSARLTEGCRMKIFGLELIMHIVTTIFEKSVGVIASAAILKLIAASVAAETRIVIFSLVVRLITTLLPVSFGYVMTAVIYFELRNVKEGVSVDSLADVFD